MKSLWNSFWVTLFCWAVSGLLIVASGLKAHELFSTPPANVYGTLALSFLIALELGVSSIWLIGRLRTALLGTSGVLFSGFAVYTALRVIGGEQNCGCFGLLNVSPIVTLGMDLVLAGLAIRLLFLQYSQRPRDFNTSSIVFFTQIRFVPCFIMAAFAATFSVALVWCSEGEMISNENLVGRNLNDLLSPTNSTAVMERVAVGQWVIYVYKPNCGKCKSQIAKWTLLSQSHYRQKTAWLSVDSASPTEAFGEIRLQARSGLRLDVPLELYVNDGRIVRASLADGITNNDSQELQDEN